MEIDPYKNVSRNSNDWHGKTTRVVYLILLFGTLFSRIYPSRPSLVDF